jgi:ABC-type sugar transport system ATPase subunit
VNRLARRSGAGHRASLAFCPEERKTEGIVEDLSIRDNIVLTLQARMGLWRKLGRAERQDITDTLARQLDIRAASLDIPIGELSGGNQQKCLIARALATKPRLLILDEPTRGIDVAGKQEIMNQLVQLASQGMALLFISAGSRRTAARVDAHRRHAGSPPGRQPSRRLQRRRGVCAHRRACRGGHADDKAVAP